MIEGLKQYAEYRHSGMTCVPELPAHWATFRIKNLFREVDRRSDTGSETLLSLRLGKGLVDHHALRGKHIPAEALVGFKKIRSGEIVMNRMRAAAGLFAESFVDGLVSPDYAVFQRSRDLIPQFFVKLFTTPLMGALFRAESRGLGTGESGFLRLYSDRFGTMRVPVPPLHEQVAIVGYLDHLDRRIRRYIAAKRKQIELLNEQKQAIIQSAVTRGLNPGVPLRPSGVEWLGDIPATWQVRRLRTLVRRIDQGVSPQAETGLAGENDWGVLKAGCANRGVFREGEHKRLPPSFEIDESLAVRVGDILVSRASGSPQLVGSVARVREITRRLILSDKTFRLVPADERLSEFLVAAMNSRYFREQVERAISGAEGLANNLPLAELKDFLLAVPNFGEAEGIARSIAIRTKSIETATARAEHQLKLIVELRTRLIADVVTGKLDVREAAAHLPEEIEDATDLAEPVDDATEPAEQEEALELA